MKKLLVTLATFIFIFSINIKAESYVLTLEESIEVAKHKSYSMQSLKEDIKIAEYNLKWATSKLRTKINMEFNLPDYQETIQQWEDSTGVSFYPKKQLKLGSRLTIDQPLPTDGKIYLNAGLSTFNDFHNNARSSSMNTIIGLSQPVDIIYGYSSIRTALKNAKLNYEQSNKSLKRAELELVTNVSTSYYQLLSQQRSTEIARLDLERQTEAYEISKNKYEAGLIREVDALQMEVDLTSAQTSYEMSLLSQESAMNSFKTLIGLELTDDITLNTDLTYKVILVDPDVAVRYALENRLEIREAEIEIEKQKLTIKQQKVLGRVRGNINAYVEKYGISNPNKELDFGGSIKESYEHFTDFKDAQRPSFGVGFTVSVPILDWGENKALVRAAESRLKQQHLRKEETIRDIENKVRNTVSDLNGYLKRLQLLEKTVTLAEKSFAITLQRFTDGDIDSQALALERDRLNNAYYAHLNAYTQYRLSITQLMQSTFYDFENEQLIQ